MSEKRLYNVTIELEVVVIAGSDREAEQGARDAVQSGDIDVYDAAIHAQPMVYYPGGWEDDSIPFGDREDADPDRTIKKWIEMGAAPDLKEKTE